MMQFMTSNVRRYAVGDLKTQLFNKNKSAIFSIANYLKSHGWQRKQAIAEPITQHKIDTTLVSANVKQFYSKQTLQKDGFNLPGNVKKASIINLPKDPNGEYWLVFPNFKAIMSYNPRVPYAMAVLQLSEAIDKKMHNS